MLNDPNYVKVLEAIKNKNLRAAGALAAGTLNRYLL